MLRERKINNRWFRPRGIWIGVGVTALVLATLLGAIRDASLTGKRESYDFETLHRSDKDLIDNFRVHRSEFDQLLRMIMEDKSLYRVDYDWTEPEHPESVGITPARIDEYRGLMKKLGILRGFSAYRERKYVEFFSSFQGSAKGYLYTKQPPPDLDASLDDVIQKGLSYGYRRIEGNWYLFYRKD